MPFRSMRHAKSEKSKNRQNTVDFNVFAAWLEYRESQKIMTVDAGLPRRAKHLASTSTEKQKGKKFLNFWETFEASSKNGL